MTNPNEKPSGQETAPIAGSQSGLVNLFPDDSRWALLLYHGEEARALLLSTEQSLVIGRERPSDVLIADPSLSREHARIRATAAEVIIEDLGSKNGTRVRGKRVARAVIVPGDEVRLGEVILSLHPTPSGEVDVPGLERHDGFRRALDQEIIRTKHFGRPLALLMVRPDERRGPHVSGWAPRVRALLGPVDRVGYYSSDTLEVMLPETDKDRAIALARAISTGHAAGEPPLVVGVALYPGSASTAEQLIDLSRVASRAATLEEPVNVSRSGPWAKDVPADGDRERPVVVSEGMRAVFDQVGRVAHAVIPVLLLGETGTGKEIVARAIHERGPRRSKGMVYLNCAAIPAQLVESILFGHERGAFTGAVAQQRGVFESADGGTLLLDEVGELSLSAQASLLRVLESKRVTRVGATREIDVDARLVAATNRDLEAMCERGEFRFDLLFRLNAITLTLPPLRDRVEEIAPLSERFLAKASVASGRRAPAIGSQAMELLRAYAWPGNVRELRNVIERAVVIAQGDEILPDDLPDRVRAAKVVAGLGGAEPEPGAVRADELRERLLRYEGQMIQAALKEAGGNQTEAARRMGMPLRTLVRKMTVLGLRDKR